MQIGLVTDSPSDIPLEFINRYNIIVIPAYLILNERSFLDGIDITRSEFYNQLPGLSKFPTTAAPSIEFFAGKFRNLLANGFDHVIGIFTAERLTSIYNNACKAAEEFPGKVSVLETGSLSIGSGYQVLEAARGISQRQPFEAILKSISAIRKRTRIFAALDTIEFLRRSGRVPNAVAALGSLIKIKPVVELIDGRVIPIEAPRTKVKSTRVLFDLFNSMGPIEHFSVLHTNSEDRANDFLQMITEQTGRSAPVDHFIINVTTVIGAHVGPGGLGFAVVKKS